MTTSPREELEAFVATLEGYVSRIRSALAVDDEIDMAQAEAVVAGLIADQLAPAAEKALREALALVTRTKAYFATVRPELSNEFAVWAETDVAELARLALERQSERPVMAALVMEAVERRDAAEADCARLTAELAAARLRVRQLELELRSVALARGGNRN
ncbi:MAG: hypothetical protein JNL21_27665 [Myxococcales bacterium]|nr:hypothetical protein [Myxococcales bacterium]